MQIDKNKYRQERINMITVMIMYITRLSRAKVLPYIYSTQTYTNIMSGDELTLCDGYSANLMDMVNEWNEKQSAPRILRNITELQIDKCNAWLRNMRVKNAKHGYSLLTDVEELKSPRFRKADKVSVLLKAKGSISTGMASYMGNSVVCKGKSKAKHARAIK